MTLDPHVTYEDVAAAHERIRAHVVKTPVLSSAAIDAHTGARVFFKCENLQNMGAFKSRGAFNALSQLSVQEKQRGVLAFSASGASGPKELAIGEGPWGLVVSSLRAGLARPVHASARRRSEMLAAVVLP